MRGMRSLWRSRDVSRMFAGLFPSIPDQRAPVSASAQHGVPAGFGGVATSSGLEEQDASARTWMVDAAGSVAGAARSDTVALRVSLRQARWSGFASLARGRLGMTLLSGALTVLLCHLAEVLTSRFTSTSRQARRNDGSTVTLELR